MPKNVVRREEIPLPPPPKGGYSSFRLVDFYYDDGSAERIWTKDDVVLVVGLTEKGEVLAVSEKGFTHIASGFVDAGEKPEDAACRELTEETGYKSEKIELVARALQDSGYSPRSIWFYIARDCTKVQDPERGISVTLMSPKALWEILTTYMLSEPSVPHEGLNPLAGISLVFQKLGWLSVSE